MSEFVKINCEVCGYNEVLDIYGKNKLVEYQRSKIQGKLPELNAENQTVLYKFKTLPKKYKCPGCGRLVSARLIKETPADNKLKVIYADEKKESAGGFEKL